MQQRLNNAIAAALQTSQSSTLSSARVFLNNYRGLTIDTARLNAEILRPLYQKLSRSGYTATGKSIQIAELTPARPSDDNVWGVIVETREHPVLEETILQFHRSLGIPIQLFHGDANESFIMRSRIRALIDDGFVHLTSLGGTQISRAEYNALFLSQNFWHAVPGRKKILVFQTDSVLCANSDFVLDDFLEFDYIGSAWPRLRPVGLVLDGGNGGLSLRDWQAMTKCLEQFPPTFWPGGEDGYFAFHLDLAAANVAAMADAKRFSTQHVFEAKSFGAHNIMDLSPDDRQAFLGYCPDALKLLGKNA